MVAASILVACAAAARPATGRAAAGLERAYAHNDYRNRNPLDDALRERFKSVEADVCVNGKRLLLSHDCKPRSVRRYRDGQPHTLESEYLRPLLRRVRREGGAVYRGDRDPFTLLVDIKSRPDATLVELNRELDDYRAMLTTYRLGGVTQRAVTVTLSGARPLDDLVFSNDRAVALDGRLEDLGRNPIDVPMVSVEWPTQFGWRGEAAMSVGERANLQGIVQSAHASGQRVRFWGTPDSLSTRTDMCRVWQELLAAHVDFINTDHLTTLHQFLTVTDLTATTPWPFSLGPAPPPGSDRLATAIITRYPCGVTITEVQGHADGTYAVHVVTAAGARYEVTLDSLYRVIGTRRE